MSKQEDTTQRAVKTRVLTGIKPTGQLHLGNYLGSINPGLRLAGETEALFMLANLHAMTTLKDGEDMRRLTYEAAASWIAAGLDPQQHIFFRQSDVPEIPLLSWILSCYSPHGLLERAHAFKSLKEKSLSQAATGKRESINAGLFFYPVLMAADIIAFDATDVPVGKDQKQHIEIARDIALAFNHNHPKVLVPPTARIQKDVALVPGIDGQKMSKNYNNTIPLFSTEKQLKKRVNQIVTDSTSLEDPKDPTRCTVFQLFSLVSDKSEIDALAAKYRAGNFGWGDAKRTLFDALNERLAPMRVAYDTLLTDTDKLDAIFADGAMRARKIARPVLARICQASGFPLAAG